MMTDFIFRNTPPGMERKNEFTYAILGAIVTFVISLSFIPSYLAAREKLYIILTPMSEPVLRDGVIMDSFLSLLLPCIAPMIIVAVSFLVFIIRAYRYYTEGSMSVYLMKRLPKRSELHRRAILIPLIMTASMLVFSLVLTFIYYLIYILFTPEGRLPYSGLENLWRY